MKRVRVVAALLAEAPGASRFLVQQRLPNVARANLWEFPGGKVEAGESDEVALARECREELSVEIEVGRLLWSTEHAYTDLTVCLYLYAATVKSGVPRALGAQQLAFCSPMQMLELPFCEADVPLLAGLVAGSIAVR